MELNNVRVDTAQDFTEEEIAQGQANLRLDKVVRTVNGVEPDANGDVSVSGGDGTPTDWQAAINTLNGA